jgi:hypothetical protein
LLSGEFGGYLLRREDYEIKTLFKAVNIGCYFWIVECSGFDGICAGTISTGW